MPIIEGKPMPIEDIDELVTQGKMTIETAKQWNETYQQLKEEFIEVAKRGMKLSQDFQHELDEFEKTKRLPDCHVGHRHATHGVPGSGGENLSRRSRGLHPFTFGDL